MRKVYLPKTGVEVEVVCYMADGRLAPEDGAVVPGDHPVYDVIIKRHKRELAKMESKKVVG